MISRREETKELLQKDKDEKKPITDQRTLINDYQKNLCRDGDEFMLLRTPSTRHWRGLELSQWDQSNSHSRSSSDDAELLDVT